MTTPDPRSLRNAFGSYMTGVTVVTTRAADGTPFGFTANSFSSVSLDPPLLLVCPGKFLSSFDHFANCSHFAVNILSEGQEDVAGVFAGFKGDRFARVRHSEDRLGNLLIDGALSQFSCSTHQTLDAGDHVILIGEVKSVSVGKGNGLGYSKGQFFSLGLERASLALDESAALCGAIIAQGDNVLLERTDTGLRPPHAVDVDRGQVRKILTNSLKERGIGVTLGPAYSVFNAEGLQCSYFLADATGPYSGAVEQHPIEIIPNLKFTSQPITDMMNRFARERQNRNFGLYLGDAKRGEIHQLAERT